MSKVIRFLVFALVCFFFIACSTSKRAISNGSNYVPKELTPLHFNLPLEDVLKIRPGIQKQKAFLSSRLIYSEDINQAGLTNVIYYFDADGEKLLYELILEYQSETERDRAAATLLGAPNNGEEWLIQTTTLSYPIKAWTFRNKLMLASLIPGTEWAK